MNRVVTATYRLQLHKGFPIASARELVPYFHRLGISHLYLSPVLAARAGSTHGYDVIDPTRVNPELGTEDDLRALAANLHALDMGIILDIVPNHMAASEANLFWDDVLQRGPSSRFAAWFDIDWDAPGATGRVVLPVLGDEIERVIERRELRLRIRDSGARVAYFDKTFPLDPSTLPKELQLAQLDPAGRPAADEWEAGTDGQARIRALLDAQRYRLTFWRHGSEINYRRFFDVNDLVATRMDTEAVFHATHRLVLAWVKDGVIDGLRIDHVDGLREPSWYLAKLRAEVDAARHTDAPQRFPIVVEKILSSDETLPHEWPVDGTTGYDFMTDVEDLFLDPKGLAAIESNYRAMRRNRDLAFQTVAREGKRRALTGSLWADVMRAARLARAWRFDVSAKEIAQAIVELIAHLKVYRTYLSEPGIVKDADRDVLSAAFQAVRKSESVSEPAIRLLEDAFLADPTPGDRLRAGVVSRIQQTSGPAAAKGVEDTALYVYIPLASRNEVGGEPDRVITDAHARVHARNAARHRDWPGTMLSTNTHDTKRSADLRARLDVLTALPGAWSRHVNRWRRLNKPRKQTVRGKPTPDTNAEHLYYQTLLGLWPAQRPERRADDLPDRDWLEAARDRLIAYMLKAAREAKTRTSWTERDPEYEKALQTFVRDTLTPGDDAHFLPDLARLTAHTAHSGFCISLARVLLQCTAPGVPDIYQGDEFWNFTLVDPDNRRPVDFQERARLLDAIETPAHLRDVLVGNRLFENQAKLALVSCLLRFRRDHARLMREGEYIPLVPRDTPHASELFAFARKRDHECAISIARTRFSETAGHERVGNVALPDELAGAWHSVLTGRTIGLERVGAQLTASVDDLMPAGQPCELLLRSDR